MDKPAFLLHDIALHDSTKFPGAGWLSNRYRVIDDEGRDILLNWPQFQKRAIEEAESLGYKVYGGAKPGSCKVIYRRVATVLDAIAVKREAWHRHHNCSIVGLKDGTFGTWEICF
jgi:hypothetical protein